MRGSSEKKTRERIEDAPGSRRSRAHSPRTRTILRGARAASPAMEKTRPPRFGRPLHTCPAPRPRRCTGPRPLRDRRWCLPLNRRRRPRKNLLPGLHHAACALPVYASQPGSPPHHATLGSGRGPALAGQDSHLPGRIEGFRHVSPSTCLPPSPGLAWRNSCRKCWPIRAFTAQNTGFSGRNRVWLKFTAGEDKPHAPTAVFRPSFPVIPAEAGRKREST